jgi:hypothetical protein
MNATQQQAGGATSSGEQRTTTARERSDASIEQTSGWTGWVVFAGIVMIMMGTFHAIQGFVALFQPSYFLVRNTGLVVHIDYAGWAWIHLGLGILVVLAGVALLGGQMWARVIAIALAFLSAMVNVSFMAAYPLWSLLLIVLDVLVIWAVTVHGDELKPEKQT